MSLTKWLAIGFGIGLVAGCDISGPRGCDICTTSAVVYGTVRSTSGNALPAALITIEARAPSCSAGAIGGNNGRVATDSAGNYRSLVISPSAPTAVCLIVTAQPSDSARFGVIADTGHVVRMEGDYPPDQVHDSVRVDLVVPPGA